MSSIELSRSVIYRRIFTSMYCNPGRFHAPSLRFHEFPSPLRSKPLSVTSSICSNDFKRFRIWGGWLNNYGVTDSVIQARTRDTDSTVGASEQSEKNSAVDVNRRSGRRSGSNRRRERQGKMNWWWWWFKILSAPEVRVLLFQLGMAIFAIATLRPERAVSGSSDTKHYPVTYLSVPYSEFVTKVNGDQVEKVEVDGVRVTFKLKREEQTGETLVRSMPREGMIVYTTTRPADFKTPYDKMLENQVEFGSPSRQSGGLFNSAVIMLFYAAVLAGLLYWLPVSFSSKTPGAGRLRSRKSEKSGSNGSKVSKQGELEAVTFADVAGVDEAKEELEEIVEFLRNPDRHTRLGARPPRGVLLVGLPGTGKTLLAKAVAGEAEVPFISCSASEFVELYVGMGASRVRDLFAWAKKEAPSIIFIDEIDAVAKSRDGKSRFISNDEREQTLNQLLTEMDGFDSNSSVIVLGATNRSDVLDPALRRPGRFDRIVTVDTPDKPGRDAILRVHVSKKELPLGDDVELDDIASMTTGFTGADLANLVNEAALLAGRQNKTVVEKIDFIHAVERSLAGIEKKTAKLQGSEKAVVARHEAGHAVVGTAIANLLPGQPQVQKLSILPRSGGALGFTYTPTNEDRHLLFVDELYGRLVTLLGGRAAEEFIYSGRVSTGALDDIRRATDIAYKAVAEYGLNQTIGPLSLSTLCGGGMDEPWGIASWGRDQGHIVDLARNEVKSLLQSAMEVALSVVRANPHILEGLGAQLEENEKVEGEELQQWLGSVVVPMELAAFIRGNRERLHLRETWSTGAYQSLTSSTHPRGV